MAINIYIGNRDSQPFVVHSEDGALTLPHLFIEPVGDDRPLVNRVRVTSIEGDPSGRVLLGAAYMLHGELPGSEAPLDRTLEVAPLMCRLNSREELPAGQYVIHVEVDFQPSAEYGVLQFGSEMTRSAARVLEIPRDLGLGCMVSGEWIHQELTVGGRGAELMIHIVNLPDNATPVVSVFDPDRKIFPSLRTAIDRALYREMPRLVCENAGSKSTVYQQQITLRSDAQNSFADVINQAPIRIPLQVAVTTRDGAGSLQTVAEWVGKDEGSLHVDFISNKFDGYPILDLGTSSTFALIYARHLLTGLLPVEQERLIRERLERWLDRTDGPFAMPEWKSVLSGAVADLRVRDRGNPDPAQAIRAHLAGNPPDDHRTDDTVHSVLKALEKRAMARNLPRAFRLGLYRELSEMYSEAFHRFPLEELRLVEVELDVDARQERSAESNGGPIPSISEVTNVNPFALEMGHSADVARQAASISNPAAVVTQFHSSPKNYYYNLAQFGKDICVSRGDRVETVTPQTFVVAALRHLRERMEKFRDTSDRLQPQRKRKFDKLVMPFPTSAPMSVRQELRKAAQEAGFDRPNLTIDEALSAIVFYLINPFGNDRGAGLEAYRSSCRPVPNGDHPPVKWTQNVLLIDVGGGTTDIALVEVTLENTQAPGAGDGSRGQYYRLVPKLLGATGQDQLAGNQLSLCIFHELKRRLADAILTAVNPDTPIPSPPSATGRFDSLPEDKSTEKSEANVARLLQLAAAMPEPFKDQATGRYRPASLLKHYRINGLWQKGIQNNEKDTLSPTAFRIANQVISTAWKPLADPSEASDAARSFHQLWKIAEEVKIKRFGGEELEESGEVTITLDQVATLLAISPADCRRLGLSSVRIDCEAFRSAVDARIKEIADLALLLSVNSLSRGEDGPIILDRLILSGQTCRMNLVREVITRRFRDQSDANPNRLWDSSCLTFEGAYAKKAAALGAAYAQRSIDTRVDPESETPLNGNVLVVDLQNLFFFLQSGFSWDNFSGGDQPVLLEPGAPFHGFDDDGIGRIASAWHRPPRVISIHRFDFKGGAHIPWGTFDCEFLVPELNISMDEFPKQFRFAIESDQRLIVSVLLCRGDRPHYELPINTPRIDVPSVLRRLNLIPSRPEPEGDEPRDDLPKDDWATHLEGWTIGVNVEGGIKNESLFQISSSLFDKSLRHPSDNSLRRGVESVELDGRPKSKNDLFYIRPSDHRSGWIHLGELERPDSMNGRRIAARAVLDDTGGLYVISGELPYAFAKADAEVLDSGLVLRKPLIGANSQYDEAKDPFCGRH